MKKAYIQYIPFEWPFIPFSFDSPFRLVPVDIICTFFTILLLPNIFFMKKNIFFQNILNLKNMLKKPIFQYFQHFLTFLTANGFLLFSVFSGSPADKADLEVADEILEINGESLENSGKRVPLACLNAFQRLGVDVSGSTSARPRQARGAGSAVNHRLVGHKWSG